MADLTITAASVSFTSGQKDTGIAGASVTAGQAVYLDAATSRYKLAQCDGTSAEADAVGIALHASGNGQPLTVAKSGSVINIGATTAAGVFYYLSATAGGIAPVGDLVSTNKVVSLGYATSTGGAFVVKVTNTGAALA